MPAATTLSVQDDDIIVVGSGIAGLVCALALAPRNVTLITKTDSLAGGSSLWAQGGIAAALGPDDSPEEHARDTLAAGAGLSDPDRSLKLAVDGIAGLRQLIDEGVPFDRALDGTLQLAHEAAHRRARVVHAGGDATGEVLVSSLIERVLKTPSIQVYENTFAYDLAISGGQVNGLMTIAPRDGWVFHRSSRVILATGGIGTCWWNTTNPKESTGDGLAIAARAGARLTDLEFMQFHPTALAKRGGDGGTSLPLMTEALRGAGAPLVDESGYRFMLDEHPSAELAPRDVVARAIQDRTSRGEAVFLDLRRIIASGEGTLFPQALSAASDAGFDPKTEALPVAPAAHYHMGGVQTDHAGRTSVAGLWACGEVATTGVHGANRLASNSLLEGLVYARRVAKDVRTRRHQFKTNTTQAPSVPLVAGNWSGRKIDAALATVRMMMSDHVGISRSAIGLESALSKLTDLHLRLSKTRHDSRNASSRHCKSIIRFAELRNVTLVSRLVTLAALRREESRGAHYRDDFPKISPQWRRRQKMTIRSFER